MGRKSRKEIEIEEKDLLEYFDPTEFGTVKDPCFGKLFSLTAEECSICGDAIFCANKQKLKLQQTLLDTASVTNELLSLESSALEKYIKAKIEAGKSLKLTRKLAKKKFKASTKEINLIINKHKADGR